MTTKNEYSRKARKKEETSVYLSSMVVSKDLFYILAQENIGDKFDPWSHLPPVFCFSYELPKGIKGAIDWPKNNFKYPKIVQIKAKEFLIVDYDTHVYHFPEQVYEKAIPMMSVRGVRNIHGTIYAVGSSRAVMRRDGASSWKAIHTKAMENQVLSQDIGKGPTHFGAIDGFAAYHDLYAGGDHSDFWHYDGKTWRAIDIPLTMMHINDICCTERGDVVAIGRFGAIIVGRGDSWQIVDTKGYTHSSMQSVVSFKGRVYIATEFRLFELTEDNRLVLVDFTGQPEPLSFGHLTTNAGWMMSTGPDTAALFDGENWKILHQIGKGVAENELAVMNKVVDDLGDVVEKLDDLVDAVKSQSKK